MIVRLSARIIRHKSTRAQPAISRAKVPPEDVFGTLSESGSMRLESEATQRYHPDDPDRYDQEEYDIKPRKNAYYYKYEISNHARKGKIGIRKAIELFREMKSDARLTPTVDNFSALIYGCSKSGYTQEAFKLYKELLKYNPKPTQSMITCLINSCGECPFPDYGYQRLKWFLDHIKIDYNRALNKIHYHSAIKAYGKLGHLDEASNLVREMIRNEIMPDRETFSMLLMGCASNREAGSVLALRIFKRMKQYNLTPDTFTYNLLLRCIRDCGMGSQDMVKKILADLPTMTTLNQKLLYKASSNRNKVLTKRGKLLSSLEWAPLLDDLGSHLAADVSITSSNASNQLELHSIRHDKSKVTPSEALSIRDGKTTYHLSGRVNPGDQTALPNLLSEDHLELFYRVESLDVQSLSYPSQRLQTFGGLHGFIEKMMQDNCYPDHKTFALLLACIEPKKELIVELFRLENDLSISRDLVHYNLLIGQMCFSKEPQRLEFAMYFIDEMQKDGIRPDIATFEALAHGCDTWTEASRLINDLDKSGFAVSETMMDKFFFSAARRYNFKFLSALIDYSSSLQLRTTKKVVEKLETVRLNAYKKILEYEKGRVEKIPYWLNDSQIKSYNQFSGKLAHWIKNVSLRDENHPWEQFDVPNQSKAEGYKKFVKNMKGILNAKQEAIKNNRTSDILALNTSHSDNM